MAVRPQLNAGRLEQTLGAVSASGLGAATVVFWAVALKMKARNASTVLCEVAELMERTGYSREEVYTAMKTIREKGHKVSWQGREHVHVTVSPDLGLASLAAWMEQTEDHGTAFQEVMDYLNEKTGRQYKLTPKVKGSLRARMTKDQMTVEDLKYVVDVKVEEWGADEERAHYVRPSTLFSPKAVEYRQQPRKASITEQRKPTRQELGRMWAG